MIILPRQARDKRRENSKKRPFSCTGSILQLPHQYALLPGQAHPQAALTRHPGAKKRNRSRHLVLKNDRFTKTGSGQTQRKRSEREMIRVSQQGLPPLPPKRRTESKRMSEQTVEERQVREKTPFWVPKVHTAKRSVCQDRLRTNISGKAVFK